MSSATSSPFTPAAPSISRLAGACIDRLLAGVRAVAFWTAALLPLVLFGALATGSASQYPTAVAGLLTLSALCAVVGHGHTPGR